jgi:hypothetical protein
MENNAVDVTKSLRWRFLPLAMLVAGIGLMCLGILINQYPPSMRMSDPGGFSPHATEILIKSLIVVGGILTFLGGTRLSMFLRTTTH